MDTNVSHSSTARLGVSSSFSRSSSARSEVTPGHLLGSVVTSPRASAAVSSMDLRGAPPPPVLIREESCRFKWI